MENVDFNFLKTHTQTFLESSITCTVCNFASFGGIFTGIPQVLCTMTTFLNQSLQKVNKG